MARAGDFNHRVGVLRYVQATDAIGAARRQWVEEGKLWCAVEHQHKPGDYYSKPANAMVADAPVWFRTRRGQQARSVTREMRLRHEGKDYRIVDIQDATGRNRELRLLCQEVTE
jgi:SPP1 family predicted phage head-tail adaptor